MSNVTNLPVGDNRVGDFTAELLDFIREYGDGLPYPAVLGAIEICKFELMMKQRETING